MSKSMSRIEDFMTPAVEKYVFWQYPLAQEGPVQLRLFPGVEIDNRKAYSNLKKSLRSSKGVKDAVNP